MSLTACAQIVQSADEDRFLASMAAPPEARAVLFPLYAFNIEVSRAPWMTEEPMIAEMRLQWWRDALEEIGSDGAVRKHEVTTPLAGILDGQGVGVLDQLVAARRWDIYKDPFEDAAHFHAYLDQTAAGLMWTAARLLGADPASEALVRQTGYAAGLARFFMALPELEARGRIPLVDGRPEAVAVLAEKALAQMPTRAELARAVNGRSAAALREAWMAAPILKQALRHPERVGAGQLGYSPFGKRLRLMLGR